MNQPTTTPGRLAARLPVALFLVAALIAGLALLQRPVTDRVALPDPHQQLLATTGMRPAGAVAEYWAERVGERPEDYLSRTSLGIALALQAREEADPTLYPEAEAALGAALELNPDYDVALLGLAAARAAQHDFVGARDLIEQVLARRPDHVDARLALADAHLDLGDYDRAIAELDELRVHLAGSAALHSRDARIAFLEGRPEEAVDAAREALVAGATFDLRPSQAAFLWFQLAHYQTEVGELDEALRSLESALVIDAAHPASSELLAELLASVGRLDEAAAHYEVLVADPAAAPDIRGELAKVYLALGRPGEAEEQVRLGLARASQVVEDFPAERRHLAGFFADWDPGRALDVALVDFETRQDVGAHETLAWALYRTGHYEEADTHIRQAMARGTRSASLLYHGGMIAAAVGDPDRARQLLTEALDLNPGFDLLGAADARAALDRLASPGSTERP